jgi:hypothetical protein
VHPQEPPDTPPRTIGLDVPNTDAAAGLANYVHSTVGGELSTQDAEALLAWYTALSAGVARFPEADLKRVEPPLISTPR